MFSQDRDDSDDVIGERTTMTRETGNGENDEIEIKIFIVFFTQQKSKISN